MLTCKWAKSKMECKEGLNHLSVEITPTPPATLDNKTVAILLVIDRSGSMSSAAENTRSKEGTPSKLHFVKDAAEKLVDLMRDGDQLGVISFDHIARIEYPLTPLSREERFVLKDRIRRIRPGGTTNVSDGLEQGYRQISKELYQTHHVKMVLLSDGKANNGITEIDDLCSIVNGYRNEGLSISTIGVGVSYNSFFMESIATSSGGMFYHLDSMNKLESILTTELETLATLTMKQAKLTLQMPTNIHRKKNLNDYSEDPSGTVYIGNVFEEQELLFEIFTDDIGASIGTIPIEVILEFQDYQGTNQRNTINLCLELVDEDDMDNLIIDQEVVESVKSLMESKIKRETIRHFEDGNIGALQSTDSSRFHQLSINYSIDVKESILEVENLKSSLSHKVDHQERRRVKEEYATNLQMARKKRK
jgi:Ca-activated chloride channel homolog